MAIRESSGPNRQADVLSLLFIDDVGYRRRVVRSETREMYAHQTKLASGTVQRLRREGGRYVRELREARGLSQRQLAALVGVEFYTFVSQIETGRGRIPPASYRRWAEALGIDSRLFVRNLMRYYDPITHEILFAETVQASV